MAVLEQRLRGLIVATALASCAAPDEAAVARRYLEDPAFRRATLVESLVAPANRYSQLRLERYESGDLRDWSRLDVWNPPCAPLLASALGAPLDASDAAPLALSPEARAGDLDALRALGETAFRRYPAQLASPLITNALRDRADAARFGFWIDPRTDHVGGLVRVRLPGGETALSYACATCHSALSPSGAIIPGLANARLDLGALGVATSFDAPPAVIERLARWGAGRVDVSTDDGSEPVAMPDLRPLRFQTHLHRAGAVAQRSLASLAVRIETLIITAHHGAVRPPREVSLALAVYLRSLADALPPDGTQPSRGRALFTARCATCHSPPGYAGGLVEASVVGTEDTLARSPDRGTGSYRIPSLRGVSAREGLLHDGAVAGLDALLDPARVRDDYTASRRGPGPVAGHAFGLDLSPADRDALWAFLSSL